MRKSFRIWSSVAAVAVLGVGVGVAAEGPGGNIANGKKIFTEGKGAAPPCLTCHGPTGWGNDAMGAPRLAKIGYAYVLKQLTDLSADRRTPAGAGAVMPMFAKELSDQDKRDVAAYVNSLDGEPELSDLKAIKESGQPVGERYLGQAIVKYGVIGKVSACSSCHGYNGRGAAPIFPVIGQQKYVYLVNQLHNWRDASRANDPSGMMRAMAKNLTDDDINNVAAFLASAPKTTEGNSVVPTTTH